jgi:predicted molibdopterin-dependent oxidoreductase YjgC
VAHQDASHPYGDTEAVSLAVQNLALLTGNIGRIGGGVATPRGPANAQGAIDMGANPAILPGGAPVSDGAARARFEDLWASRAGDTPVSLPTSEGVGLDHLPAAIESGDVKALWLEVGIRTRDSTINQALFDALARLEFLVVVDAYDSPFARIADVVLPLSLNLEKDGTFTNFDRTVQRVRAAVPAMGEAHTSTEILGAVADRLGYTFPKGHASQIMSEIASVVPGYAGITYARLERGGIVTPVERFSDQGMTVLTNGQGPLHPAMVTLHGS